MRFRPTLWATLFVVPALVVLIALGVWQVERRAEKHALLARVDAGLQSDPRDLVEVLAGPVEDQAYARVEADGEIARDKAIHVFSPTGQGAADYRIIAPLDYGGGRFILVDLGTITEVEKARLGTGIPPQATGRVHVEGVLRPSEPSGMFTAAPDLKQNRWYVRDVPAMAAALGVPVAAPLLLQSETPHPGGLPRPVPFRPDLPDNHLAYAVTWFSLALILAVVYVLFHLKRRDDGR